jgi:hypothetical protein
MPKMLVLTQEMNCEGKRLQELIATYHHECSKYEFALSDPICEVAYIYANHLCASPVMLMRLYETIDIDPYRFDHVTAEREQTV